MYFMSQIHSLAYKFFNILKEFPYLSKRIIFATDLLVVAVSFTISYWICTNLIDVKIFFDTFFIELLICIVVTGGFFILFKTYSGILRYSTYRDAMRIFLSVFCANLTLTIVNILISYYIQPSILSWESFFINFIQTFCLVFFLRMSVRLLFDFVRDSNSKELKSLPLLVYGINPTSIGLAKTIISNEKSPYYIGGFISPDRDLANKKVINYPIYFRDEFFMTISSRRRFNALLINPTELEYSEKQWIVDKCLQHKIELLSAPPVEEWKDDEKNFKELKKVNIIDLLGRVPIQIDIDSIGKRLEGKTVLVTGAAGSIGSEIARQVGQFQIKTLLICDVAESPLHELSLQLQDKFPVLSYVPILADVRNYNQMKKIFDQYRPHYIYHAAAYKHVPLMEEHPCEAVLTNVIGTRNVVDLSVLYNSETFVMISTDKAVNPTNVMGASKRVAEIYVQTLSQKIKTQSSNIRIITTRFGNVLDSNGSVIPRFRDQINKGGPVTVTHPDIIRYFMTIPEACRLVLEAGNLGLGGEVLVFDMGDPVKIKDLAENMIRLSGLKPYEDIEIKFTGLRPGEKLYEELLYNKELAQSTHNKKILIGKVREYDYDKVLSHLDKLVEILSAFDKMGIVKWMKELVPEYVSKNSKYEELDIKNSIEV
jgi:FlaA1/EpsC-like NDP-sugar epimerase